GKETAFIEIKSMPNQGIYQSIKNSLVFGLVFGLLIGIWDWLGFREPYGVAYALIGTLILGTIQGGYAVINHYSLRLVLSLTNLLPWRLVPFLDHCIDLIFLRRVGSGYIFIHRLLMEHFAEMYTEAKSI
ncbi:MAG TPA: hypothetical protein PLT08_17470, partial [Anaerolineales bacterium]|nr:hypothetical protein [Anaerolineales bacterium]